MTGTALEASPPGRQSPALRSATTGVRLDIQVLRALAVGIVVAYHCWPEWFPGGFVGVDAFFVLSGLLITDHLMRELEATGSIRVARFWGRRARRLLPLAFVVLLVTAALILVLLPVSQHRDGLLGVLWSSMYVQNWSLGLDSINYLARDQEALLTQHFWSLSAEEQFYLVWPLLLVGAVAFGVRLLRGRARPRRSAALVAVVLVLMASLMHSICLTATSPGTAYFATTTRAWEFAAGALLAFVPQGFSWLRRNRLATRVAASWLGVAMIVGTTLWLPSTAPFPSATALLPVGGTVLCLMAGDVRRGDPSLLAGVRSITWLGDVSYGIYLWHWPLLLAAPFLLGQPMTDWQKLVLIVLVIALAGASKRWIEDPIRFSSLLQSRSARSLTIPIVGTAVVAALVLGSLWVTQQRADAARAELETALAQGRVVEVDPSLPLVPSVETRGSDSGTMYDCFDLTRAGMRACEHGPPDAEVHIAAFGDSHMAQLLPGLQLAAEERGWHLTTYVGMSCDSLSWEYCAGGSAALDALVSGGYDAVLTSSSRISATEVDEIAPTWQRLLDARVDLIPIVDTPWHSEESFACVDASGGDARAAADCASPRSTALRTHPDRIAPLAASFGIEPIDLTDALCDERSCATVVQNVLVFQDSPASHLTATASGMLASRMGDDLERHLTADG